MELPTNVRSAIEQMANGVKTSELQKVSNSITSKYRESKSNGTRLITNDMEAKVYSIVRMPATYGAVYKALFYSFELLENISISNMLDVGAGTGAASLAALSLLDIKAIDCVERELSMAKVGEEIIRASGFCKCDVKWHLTDIIDFKSEKKYDLVIASYALNEISKSNEEIILKKLWDYTRKVLIIVEPGTPLLFAMQQRIRRNLLNQGASLIAPCPHMGECKLDINDWCHFTCRIARSHLHRIVKGGDSPFEDEKFTYSAFVRDQVYRHCAQRVIRHPTILPKQTIIKVCCENGEIVNEVYIKKDGEKYKKAKKAQMGDAFKFLD